MSTTESKFDVYTADDLTGLERRLHINTAITLMINVLAVYCIFSYSTKSMNVYKWYLLIIQLTTALFDFHLTVIFVPFPTFPIPGFCAAGIWSRHWDYLWGVVIPFILLHWFLCFQGMAIIYGILYRYRVITEKMEWMNATWVRILMVIIPLIYPIPAAAFLITYIADKTIILAFLRQNAPEMLELYSTESCSAAIYSTSTALYCLTAVTRHMPN